MQDIMGKPVPYSVGALGTGHFFLSFWPYGGIGRKSFGNHQDFISFRMAWPRKRFDFPIAIVLRHLQVYILNCPAALVPPKFGRSSRRRGTDFLGIQSDSVVLGKGNESTWNCLIRGESK